MDIESRTLVPEARQFLQAYRVKDNAEGTVKARVKHLELFSEWLDETNRDLMDCDFEDIIAYIGYLKNEKEYAGKTIKGYISGVSILYEYLMKKREVDRNPVSRIDLPDYISYKESQQAKELKTEDEVIWLDRNEIRKLTENVQTPRLRNKLIIQLLYQTGVRRQEACDIELGDVDREERSIKIRGKGEKNRTVYYGKRLDILLDAWLDKGYRSSSPFAAESDYLLLSHEATQLHGNTLNKIIKDAADEAGIQSTIYTDSMGREKQRVTTHSIRHSFAVEYLRQGGSIERLRVLMGHASVETTEKYAKVLDEDVKNERSGLDIGNEIESSASDETCKICDKSVYLESHHVSYDPPITIDVCSTCHAKIHHSDQYDGYLPDMTLDEAKSEGLID